MSVIKKVEERSQGVCELCASAQNTSIFFANEQNNTNPQFAAMLCQACLDQVQQNVPMNSAHFAFLENTMWSEIEAIQVISWRMLNRLKNETWAADLLDMMYLDEDTLKWAQQTNDHLDLGPKEFHTDCNGAILTHGDTVTLIKDLDVKGSSITAKMGTAVRNIRLVPDNHQQIEGKVDGQQIVILTQYVRKQHS